jgi:Domain of unknown function (DUF6468)
MTWAVVLDVFLAVLLILSIATTAILSRRLSAMRGDRAELEQLARHFQDATSRADNGVNGLKVSVQSLQERIDTARSLADDLEFLIERGGGLADRLEAEVRARRPEARPETRAVPSPQSRPDKHSDGRAHNRSSVLSALGGDPRARPKGKTGSVEPRTEAERHLLAALRAHG